MSRRLPSLLLAAVAAAAIATFAPVAPSPSNVARSAVTTSTPTSATTTNEPKGAPVLSVRAHGTSTVGSDGSLFIRTDTPGSLDVVGAAPTGNSTSNPGTFSLVASADAFGWDAGPTVSPGPALVSEWHWQTGASSLAVALSYVSPDGSTSPAAVQAIVAVADRPTVHVEPIAGQPNATTADLSWTETDGIGPGIVDRQILREEAPATTQGCGEWTRRDITGVAAADVTYTPAFATLRLTGLSLGHCYRFTLFVTDALGLVGQDTTLDYVPGVLDMQDQPLPAWTGRIDIFRASAFASQQEWTWCVAASTQMMLNLIGRTSDSSYDGQLNILRYERDNDMLPDSDPGAGLIGWQGALDKFSGTRYEVETVGSLEGAVRLAALRLRLTNRPVGLAVNDTTHAWVMTGFEATSDPAFDPGFKVTAVYVSGPLYPRSQSHGYDKAPDTRLSVEDLGRYFTPVKWKGRPTWKFVAPLP